MKNAKKFKVFDENGNELKSYKNVANEQDEQESFSMVKNGYRVIQHQDVFDTVQEAIDDKNLNATAKPHRDYDGNSGRLHIEVTFDDITLDVEGNGIQSKLYCTYDNSYDGTTGLRLSVGAKLGNAVLWIVGSRYYHKHTKSVSVKAFEDSLEKGIDAFQTKIKEHFKGMYKTPTTEAQAIDLLENCEGVKNISYKSYIEPIITKVKQSNIKNKWQLYCLICEEITTLASSIDVRDRHLKAVIGRLHKAIRSSSTTVTTPSTPEGGATLKEAVDSQVTQVVNGPVVSLAMATPPKLTIDRQGKRKFVVMMGDTKLETFRKHRQASKYIQKSA